MKQEVVRMQRNIMKTKKDNLQDAREMVTELTKR